MIGKLVESELLEAAYENHREDVARREADYMRELNAKLEQINAQAKTIRELVDALTLCVNTLRDKRIGTVDYMEGSRIYSDFRVASEKGENALSKVQSYPLPDGRTK